MHNYYSYIAVLIGVMLGRITNTIIKIMIQNKEWRKAHKEQINLENFMAITVIAICLIIIILTA